MYRTSPFPPLALSRRDPHRPLVKGGGEKGLPASPAPPPPPSLSPLLSRTRNFYCEAPSPLPPTSLYIPYSDLAKSLAVQPPLFSSLVRAPGLKGMKGPLHNLVVAEGSRLFRRRAVFSILTNIGLLHLGPRQPEMSKP